MRLNLQSPSLGFSLQGLAEEPVGLNRDRIAQTGGLDERRGAKGPPDLHIGKIGGNSALETPWYSLERFLSSEHLPWSRQCWALQTPGLSLLCSLWQPNRSLSEQSLLLLAQKDSNL